MEQVPPVKASAASEYLNTNVYGIHDEERREIVVLILLCALAIVAGYMEASGVFNVSFILCFHIDKNRCMQLL
jgi:hypothetical protein